MPPFGLFLNLFHILIIFFLILLGKQHVYSEDIKMKQSIYEIYFATNVFVDINQVLFLNLHAPQTPLVEFTSHPALSFSFTVPPYLSSVASCIPLHAFRPLSYVSKIFLQTGEFTQVCRNTSPVCL